MKIRVFLKNIVNQVFKKYKQENKEVMDYRIRVLLLIIPLFLFSCTDCDKLASVYKERECYLHKRIIYKIKSNKNFK